MGRKSNKGEVKKFQPPVYDRKLWSDMGKDEFNLILRVEDLIEYAFVYEFIGGKALGWFPDKKERDKGVWSKL